MSTIATKYTPADLLRMPDANSTELVNGDLVEKNVSEQSSGIGGKILWLLANVAFQSGEARVYPTDLGYQCFPDEPNRIRKPDVSVIRKERLKPLGSDVGYMPIPADLVVEVVSPNDIVYDLSAKIQEYIDAGFHLIWIVYPQQRQVHIRRADGSSTVLHANDEITGEQALPTFKCRVGDFFT